MSTEKKYKLEKSYSIFERVGSGKLVIPVRDYYGRDETIFSDHDTEEEAMEEILERGDTFIDYIVIPSFRKVDA